MIQVCDICNKSCQSFWLYYSKEQTKVLCQEHSSRFSSIKMSRDELEQSLDNLQEFFNDVTSKVLNVINSYKTSIFQSYISIEKAAYELSNAQKSKEQKMSNIKQLQFPLNSFQMKLILNKSQYQKLCSSVIGEILQSLKLVYKTKTQQWQSGSFNHKVSMEMSTQADSSLHFSQGQSFIIRNPEVNEQQQKGNRQMQLQARYSLPEC